MERLEKLLKEHNLEQGLKHSLIKERDDYFKQAVIIIATTKQTDEILDLAYELDVFFQTEGYKEHQFIQAVAKYFQELEELYKMLLK